MAEKSDIVHENTDLGAAAEQADASHDGDLSLKPHLTRTAIHTDTYDIDVAALGTNLPKRYYWSPGFLGTVLVCSFILHSIIATADLTIIGPVSWKYQ